MNEELSDNHVCIIKTRKLFKFDMAINALKEKNIPFYKQLETSSGLKLAMPFQPAMGPGTFYKIFVPKLFSDRSKEILDELPIDQNVEPEIWHFGANENIKKKWKIFIWLMLAIAFSLLVADIYSKSKFFV
mgnify:CR=1 FL=1|jgi:hypothetical protein